jgi:hypothetical protein
MKSVLVREVGLGYYPDKRGKAGYGTSLFGWGSFWACNA